MMVVFNHDSWVTSYTHVVCLRKIFGEVGEVLGEFYCVKEIQIDEGLLWVLVVVVLR